VNSADNKSLIHANLHYILDSVLPFLSVRPNCRSLHYVLFTLSCSLYFLQFSWNCLRCLLCCLPCVIFCYRYCLVLLLFFIVILLPLVFTRVMYFYKLSLCCIRLCGNCYYCCYFRPRGQLFESAYIRSWPCCHALIHGSRAFVCFIYVWTINQWINDMRWVLLLL